MDEVLSRFQRGIDVSMKSGLEGRNNRCFFRGPPIHHLVSMKSGLEGRNNTFRSSGEAERLKSQ